MTLETLAKDISKSAKAEADAMITEAQKEADVIVAEATAKAVTIRSEAASRTEREATQGARRNLGHDSCRTQQPENERTS